MVSPVMALAITSFIGIISLGTLALQRQIPTPQQSGDYNSAITTFPDGSEAILLSWFTNISSGTLNCRNAPRNNQQVIHEFQPDQLLQADAGVNHSEEPIIKDSQGKPWLRVKIVNNQGETQGTCFVRAHEDFIVPNSLE
jgi:hypothetical protein